MQKKNMSIQFMQIRKLNYKAFMYNDSQKKKR